MREKTKDKILIYGAGNNLLYSYYDLNRCFEIVGIIDGNKGRIGEIFFGKQIEGTDTALMKKYDRIIVTPANKTGIINMLSDAGVHKDRIVNLQDVYDGLGDEWDKREINYADSEEKSEIAVVFYGGMGDLLIGRRWLEAIAKKYKVSYDLFSIFLAKGSIENGKEIFGDIIGENCIYAIDSKNLDFFSGKSFKTVLRFCILPEVWIYTDSDEILKESGLDLYLKKLIEFGRENYNRGFFTADGFSDTIKKNLIEKDGVLYHTAFDVFGDLGGSEDTLECTKYNGQEEKYLTETGLWNRAYITLNTGLNSEYINKNNTRAWSFDNWVALSKKLKEEYPEIKIVQVGTRMRDEDDIPADIHFNGKTDLKQISILMKYALLHIDYDGGLVHVRHMFGGRSIVMMGPSSAEKHAYPENIYIQTKVCKPCEWQSSDWLSVCGKGYDVPACMDSITPDMVMDVIKKSIKEIGKNGDKSGNEQENTGRR